MLLLETAKHSLKKKWNALKTRKIQYQKVVEMHQEEDDNLANEKLELKIIQIFQLKSGIPANPDQLFALLDDGSFIQLCL